MLKSIFGFGNVGKNIYNCIVNYNAIMKINQLKYTQEQIKSFGEYYLQGHSLKETSEKFNVNYHTLKQNLIRFGYRTPKKKLDHQRVEKICYFDNIDTSEKSLYFRISFLRWIYY